MNIMSKIIMIKIKLIGKIKIKRVTKPQRIRKISKNVSIKKLSIFSVKSQCLEYNAFEVKLFLQIRYYLIRAQIQENKDKKKM